MIAKMEKTFKEDIKSLKLFATPGAPIFQLARPEEEDKLIGKGKTIKVSDWRQDAFILEKTFTARHCSTQEL